MNSAPIDQHRTSRLALGLLALTSIVATTVAGCTWRYHVLDRAPVRQEQTLLAIQGYLRHGFSLLYETPIFSYPWRAPLEFPLYQWIAAAFAQFGGIRPEYAAQAVTILFFVLTLAVGWRALRDIGVSFRARSLVVSLALASPLFLFWSLTVTIESTALFFSVAWVSALVRYHQSGRLSELIAAMGLGAVAAAVKSTTFAPWAMFTILLGALATLRPDRTEQLSWRRLLATAIVGLLVPFLAGAAWTSYADEIKEHSGLAVAWTSYNLREYVLGSLAQRTSFAVWATTLGGRTVQLLGFPLLLVSVPIALIRRTRWSSLILVSLVAHVATYAAFPILHLTHDYYSYANGLLLILAVALAAETLLDSSGAAGALVRISMALSVVGMYAFFALTYAPAYAYSRGYSLEPYRVVSEVVPPGEAVAQAGGYATELVYATGRPGIAGLPDVLGDAQKMQAALGPTALGGATLCGEHLDDPEWVARVVTTHTLLPLPFALPQDCAFFAAKTHREAVVRLVERERERQRWVPHLRADPKGWFVVDVREGPVLTVLGTVRHSCRVTQGQRLRLLLRSPTASLAYEAGQTSWDPIERVRARLLRAYPEWSDGNRDVTLFVKLSPYVLGATQYQLGVEVWPAPGCPDRSPVAIWSNDSVTGSSLSE